MKLLYSVTGCRLIPGVGSDQGGRGPEIVVLLQETFALLSSFQMTLPAQEALDQPHLRELSIM